MHFIQLRQLAFLTPFMLSFKLYSQMLIQYSIFSLAFLCLDFLPQVSQGLSLPWLLKVNQFTFLRLGSSTHRSLASLQTLPVLLLFLLAIWHNLMALAASCFPFYHLRCFGYSAINLDYPIHSGLIRLCFKKKDKSIWFKLQPWILFLSLWLHITIDHSTILPFLKSAILILLIKHLFLVTIQIMG